MQIDHMCLTKALVGFGKDGNCLSLFSSHEAWSGKVRGLVKRYAAQSGRSLLFDAGLILV